MSFTDFADMQSGLTQFRVTYELSPIILLGGIAQNVPGGMIPIISLLEAQNYDLGLLSASSDLDWEDFFAKFTPLPGASLLDNQIATYPFLNQTVAANAVIAQPLKISLLMTAPVKGEQSYADKIAIMSALQSSLQQHTAQGGTYNVATPAFIYSNCLLTSLSDVSSADTDQVQFAWRWDFLQPLVTLAAAQAAQNTQMSKISSLTQMAGDPPGASTPANAIGQPGSNIGPNVVPAAQQPGGASVPGPQPIALVTAPPPGS